MNIQFEKYHGTGNDFIILDNRNEELSLSDEAIRWLCDRHYGIGADGLIMLGKAEGYDFSMRYFNADGYESSMCGNGGRCITAYAKKHGIIKNKAVFTAPDGEHEAEIIGQAENESLVRLQMQNVKKAPWTEDTIFLNTGSPHYIVHSSNIQSCDLATEGSKLRNHARFEAIGGTNVNFIEEVGQVLHIRTYERGVEAETLSCGTGVTAAGLAWTLKTNAVSPIALMAPGGKLKVYFEHNENEFNNIWLEGPARYVYSGQVEI